MIEWPWSTEISAAIQALASVAVLLVTAALAGFTWTYVKHTRSLVDLTRAQAELAELQRRREELSAANAFLSLVSRLQNFLIFIAPEDGAVHDRMIRTSPIWTAADIAEFERLAAAVFSDDPHPLSVLAVSALTGLLQLAEQVRATNPSMGFSYNEHFTSSWGNYAGDAHHALGRLSAAVVQRRPAK